MRGLTTEYELKTPKDLREVLLLLEKEPCTLFAGGTDLMVLLEAGIDSGSK